MSRTAADWVGSATSSTLVGRVQSETSGAVVTGTSGTAAAWMKCAMGRVSESSVVRVSGASLAIRHHGPTRMTVDFAVLYFPAMIFSLEPLPAGFLTKLSFALQLLFSMCSPGQLAPGEVDPLVENGYVIRTTNAVEFYFYLNLISHHLTRH